MSDYTAGHSSQEIPFGLCHCGCSGRTTIAKRSDKRSGAVKGQPYRYLHGHGTRRPPLERFWEQVEKHGPDDCWNWTGHSSRDHGQLRINGKQTYVHRFSYEIHVGPIPEGLFVCHRCSNSLCVNPAHLYVGAQTDNMRDMILAGNHAHAGGRPGKLTKEQAAKIRHLYALGNVSYESLGKQFGVSRSTIRRVVRQLAAVYVI